MRSNLVWSKKCTEGDDGGGGRAQLLLKTIVTKEAPWELTSRPLTEPQETNEVASLETNEGSTSELRVRSSYLICYKQS